MDFGGYDGRSDVNSRHNYWQYSTIFLMPAEIAAIPKDPKLTSKNGATGAFSIKVQAASPSMPITPPATVISVALSNCSDNVFMGSLYYQQPYICKQAQECAV